MAKVAIFKDRIIDAYSAEVGGAQEDCNNWLDGWQPNILSIQATSQMSEYTWIPENTRGAYDHQKRDALFTTIVVLYDDYK